MASLPSHHGRERNTLPEMRGGVSLEAKRQGGAKINRDQGCAEKSLRENEDGGNWKCLLSWGQWEMDSLTENYDSFYSVAQSCPTLCDPMDCSPPGFSVHGIFQARILEKVAISFFRGSSQPKDQTFHFLHWQADSLPLVPPGKPFQEIHANEILWDEMFMMSTIHS